MKRTFPDEQDKEFDIDSYLRKESIVHSQSKEVERLVGFKETIPFPNPLEVFNVPVLEWPHITWPKLEKIVKNTFRRISLLVHPDKCSLEGSSGTNLFFL